MCYNNHGDFMFTYDDFIKDLEHSGINRLDTVMVHSAFSSISDIEGGAETVIRALKDYFKDGLLLFPTHTWATMKKDGDVFDKKKTNSCVGYLTNKVIEDPDFLRSNHPTHSVCAFGANAKEYIKDDDNAKTPVPPNGSFGKLKYEGKILFIGCPLSKNTFIHSIEEEMEVPDRFTEHIYKFKTKTEDELLEFNMPKHFNPSCEHISDNYEKLKPYFISNGILRRIKLLNSQSYVLDANKTYTMVKHILSADIHAFDDQRDIGEYV